MTSLDVTGKCIIENQEASLIEKAHCVPHFYVVPSSAGAVRKLHRFTEEAEEDGDISRFVYGHNIISL